MADFDFLDGFDTGGDWGFTGVSEKPSDKAVSDSKATEQVVKQTSESVGKAVEKINNLLSISVRLVWYPKWEKKMMSEEAKLALDIY